LCQQEVPPGDGGISLGQAAWAQACLRAGLPTELV
jgi:hydrogenase maturation protein HypF